MFSDFLTGPVKRLMTAKHTSAELTLPNNLYQKYQNDYPMKAKISFLLVDTAAKHFL